MESVILSFLARLFSGFMKWFDESLFGKAVNRFLRALSTAFRSSLTGSLFNKMPSEEKTYESSILFRIIRLPEYFCKWLSAFFERPFKNITRNSGFVKLIENYNIISMRFYGVGMISYSLLNAGLLYLGGGLDGKMKVLDALLLIAGTVLTVMNKSAKQIFSASVPLRAAAGIFYDVRDESSTLFLKSENFGFSIRYSILIGFAVAVLQALSPTVLPLAVLFGMVFALIVFKRTAVGIFVVIIGSPILPTMVLAGLSILCVISVMVRLITDKSYRLEFSPLNIFAVMFAAAVIYGAVNSFTFAASLKIAFIYLSFILFYFVIINGVKDKKTWKTLVSVFTAVAAAVALYGIFQNFFGVSSAQSWVDADMFKDIKTRVYSTFDNPNVLGEFLVIMIPVTFAVLCARKALSHKVVYTLFFALMCGCLVYTWSRGAWLGVMLAICLFLVVADKRFLLLGVLALFALPVILGSNNAISNRLLSIGNTEDTSTAYRVSIWYGSIGILKDFWLSGIGLGSDAFAAVYPKYSLSGASYALHAHNLFLQIWVSMGILGIVSFVALIIAFIREVFNIMVTKSKNRFLRIVLIALGAGTIGYLFQAMTDNVWYNYKMLLIFWIVLGLVSSGVNILKKEGDGK